MSAEAKHADTNPLVAHDTRYASHLVPDSTIWSKAHTFRVKIDKDLLGIIRDLRRDYALFEIRF
jgi:hypothetical protein